jgi:hypothetical protein
MKNPVSPRISPDLRQRLDAFGAAASLVCAAHCIILPLLLAVLPATTLSSLESPAFDRGFVVFAALFGAIVIGSGVARGQWRRVVALYALGVASLALGAFVWHSYPLHAMVLGLGGAAVAGAHLLNRHAIQRHGDTSINLWAVVFRRLPA